MRRFTCVLLLIPALAGCSRGPQAAMPSAFYVFRLEPPALLQLSADRSIVRELPVTIPGGCTLDGLFPPPMGTMLAIEFGCSFGQAVVFLNTDSGEMKQPVADSDSHFMAWAPDGKSIYLKVDTIGRPHVVRAALGGGREDVPVTELAYDISPKPANMSEFLFSFSRGMGLGSETWLAQSGGEVVKQVIADPHSYLSFARWSPDERKVAFIKIPDSATPFTVGELWVMQADGSDAHKIADADAGHGYAEAWSPDGQQIAFVVRENPNEAQADQEAGALKSNLSVVNVGDGSIVPLTHLQNARVEAPVWSPVGNTIAFTAVLDDRMNVYSVDVKSGEVQEVLTDSACCPVWMRE